MIAFGCPSCGQTLKVKDELAGKRGKCPACKAGVLVPEADPAPQPAAADNAVSDAVTLAPADPARRGGDTQPSAAPKLGAAGRELTDFLAPAQADDELGRLGPYRVLRVLGHGGMGVVYEAEDPLLQRKVALKVMLPALAASESARERFLREARAAGAVEHDHIVPIYAVGEDRGVPFIAMPLLRGEPLDRRLKRERRLPLAEVARIGRETAAGLAAAHDKGLVHRDVKPANVWLEEGTGRVKVLDFGLARLASGNAQLTQSGVILGTPAYMAPEQAAGKEVDGRCDLFSLGCVLYEASTGELPFKGADVISTLVAVSMEVPPTPRQRNPRLPRAFSDLVMRLLAKDPADRPRSARAVVDALDGIEHRPVEPATAEHRIVERVSPVTVAGKRRVTEAPPPIPRRRRPKRPAWVVPAVVAGVLGLVAVLAGLFVLWRTVNRGELVVESDDPGVEVSVVQEGKRVATLDGGTNRRVMLAPGVYDVALSRGGRDLRLSADHVTLTRGGRESVRVLRNVVVADRGPVVPAAPPRRPDPPDVAPPRPPVERPRGPAAPPGPETPEGVLPLGADGQPLNLDFETGTLKDWAATGNAFRGQPTDGDTVNRRRGNLHSRHQGRFWIGTFEWGGDRPQGTLTSAPFRVTHPWASFLVGGGAFPTTCVELVRRDTGQVFFRASGVEEEQLRRVAVDLRPHRGQQIFIRLVDRRSGPWGHINFDNFRFHSNPPEVSTRPSLPPDLPQLVNPGFEAGILGWSVAHFGAPASVGPDTKVVHGGRQSLHIGALGRPADVAVGQEVQLRPGHRYRLTGWVRTARLDPHKATVFGTLQVQNPGGRGTIASGPNHRGDTEWTRVEVPFEAPGDGRVRISAFFIGFGRGTGVAWFDDLNIEALEAP
jgi:hypothetical protein